MYPQSFQGLKDHLTEAHDFEDVLKDEGAEENYDEQDLDEANESEPDSTTKERIQCRFTQHSSNIHPTFTHSPNIHPFTQHSPIAHHPPTILPLPIT